MLVIVIDLTHALREIEENWCLVTTWPGWCKILPAFLGDGDAVRSARFGCWILLPLIDSAFPVYNFQNYLHYLLPWSGKAYWSSTSQKLFQLLVLLICKVPGRATSPSWWNFTSHMVMECWLLKIELLSSPHYWRSIKSTHSAAMAKRSLCFDTHWHFWVLVRRKTVSGV